MKAKISPTTSSTRHTCGPNSTRRPPPAPFSPGHPPLPQLPKLLREETQHEEVKQII